MDRLLPALLTAALVGLAACAPAPPSGPASGPAPLPIVRLAPGAADTVDVRHLDVVAASAPDGLRAALLADGRLVVRAGPGFEGIDFVQLGGEHVLPVQSNNARDDVQLSLVGPRPGDPSVLDVAFRYVGAGEPPELDEEDAVALWGDEVVSDNASDVDVADGVVGVDLDAVGTERRRLRVAVRSGALVSNWVEVEVENRRPVR